MAAHQAPPSLGFSRQEHCRHFLLQCMKVKSESDVAQSCPTLSYPMDCSLPGSSVRGIFQAGVLEWGAIAFSGKGCQVVNNKTSPIFLAEDLSCGSGSGPRDVLTTLQAMDPQVRESLDCNYHRISTYTWSCWAGRQPYCSLCLRA